MRYCSRERESFPDAEFTWNQVLQQWFHKPAGGSESHPADRGGPGGVLQPLPEPLDVPWNQIDDS